jgi:hypothetical protein
VLPVVTAGGCAGTLLYFRAVRSTALAARGAVVRIGPGWTNVLAPFSVYDAGRRRTATTRPDTQRTPAAPRSLPGQDHSLALDFPFELAQEGLPVQLTRSKRGRCCVLGGRGESCHKLPATVLSDSGGIRIRRSWC